MEATRLCRSVSAASGSWLQEASALRSDTTELSMLLASMMHVCIFSSDECGSVLYFSIHRMMNLGDCCIESRWWYALRQSASLWEAPLGRAAAQIAGSLNPFVEALVMSWCIHAFQGAATREVCQVNIEFRVGPGQQPHPS